MTVPTTAAAVTVTTAANDGTDRTASETNIGMAAQLVSITLRTTVAGEIGAEDAPKHPHRIVSPGRVTRARVRTAVKASRSPTAATPPTRGTVTNKTATAASTAGSSRARAAPSWTPGIPKPAMAAAVDFGVRSLTAAAQSKTAAVINAQRVPTSEITTLKR
jgi:hypothetical protein